MKLTHILSGIVMAAALVACADTFSVPDPVIATEYASYTIPAEGGVVSVSFHSNMPWRIEVIPANDKSSTEGITVSPAQGEGSSKRITVNVTARPNPDTKREVIFSILGTAVDAAFRVLQPGASDPTEIKGTLATPYGPSELVAMMMGGDVPADQIYIRGIISKIKEISTDYGNATFWITDDGTHPDSDNDAFQVYRGRSFGGEAITDPEIVKVGDVVTLLSNVTVYNGTVPETVQNKCEFVAINGFALPAGEGTEESPWNAAKAMAEILAVGEASTPEVYVKGVISKIKEVSPSYGNATYYITDDGVHPAADADAVQVFRGKWFGGASFTDEEQIKVGDQVVIKGTLTNYKGNTPEVNTGSTLVLLNGNSE